MDTRTIRLDTKSSMFIQQSPDEEGEECPFCNCYFPKDRNVCPNLKCFAFRVKQCTIGKNLEHIKVYRKEIIIKLKLIRGE